METFRIWSPGVKTQSSSLSPEASLILPSSWFRYGQSERERFPLILPAILFKAFLNVKNGKADAGLKLKISLLSFSLPLLKVQTT